MQKRTRDEIISSGLTKPTAIYPITILRGLPVPGSVGVTNMHESQSDSLHLFLIRITSAFYHKFYILCKIKLMHNKRRCVVLPVTTKY